MIHAARLPRTPVPKELSLFPAGFYRPYELAAQHIFLLCSQLRDAERAHGADPGVCKLTYRLKTPSSIGGKLRARGLPVTPLSAERALHDVAGVRVVFADVDQVYRFAALLRKAPGIEVYSERDYIKHPKRSGYRSLHLILHVPVHIGKQTMCISAEVQLRTASMDTWANIEHDAIYKPVRASR